MNRVELIKCTDLALSALVIDASMDGIIKKVNY